MAKRKVAPARANTQAPPAPRELASLADVQIVRRDAERLYPHEEDRPKPWQPDALLSAVQVIEGADFDGPDTLRQNLDFLLDPTEIAFELRGLAALCRAVGRNEDIAEMEAPMWAVEHALLRVAARVEMLQKPAAKPLHGPELYAVVAKPTPKAAA